MAEPTRRPAKDANKRLLNAVPSPPQIRARSFMAAAEDGGQIRLTARHREQLMRIGTRLRLQPRMRIYEEGDEANAVYAITEGSVKVYRDLPSGKRSLCAFLFERDLFGLAELGHYVNSAQAVTAGIAYRLPLQDLAHILKQDSELQFQFLMKVTHELRESQRRAVMVNRKDAPGRLAMFIAMMHQRLSPGEHRVPLPMSRSDIAAFLGLSLESVCRAVVDLERRGLVKFEGRHSVTITEPARLARLAAAI